MTDEKKKDKKDKKDDKEAKKMDDEQLKDVAGGFSDYGATILVQPRARRGGKKPLSPGDNLTGTGDDASHARSSNDPVF